MLIKVFNVIINTEAIYYLVTEGGDIRVSFGADAWCTIKNKTLVEVQVEINRVTRERLGHVD